MLVVDGERFKREEREEDEAGGCGGRLARFVPFLRSFLSFFPFPPFCRSSEDALPFFRPATHTSPLPSLSTSCLPRNSC